MAKPPVASRTNPDLDRLRRFYEIHAKESGARVKARRQVFSLKQDGLAELVGVPYQTIGKVERGEIVPRDYLKAAIALRLMCEVTDLWPHPTRFELSRVA